MSEVKISDAAVEAARHAYTEADERNESGWLCARAAIAAALPHLHPQPAELAEQQGGGMREVADKLRRAGARLPAPPVTGTVQGSMVTGLSIALALVEEALAATGKQRVVDLPEDVVERCRTLPTDKLLNCALEVYARSCRYGTKGQHDAAMAYKDEIVRRIDGSAAQVGEVQGAAPIVLPPMPHGQIMPPDDRTGDYPVAHDDEAMRDYAREAVEADRAARQPGAQEPVGELIYRWDRGPHGEWEFAPEKPVIAVLSRTPKIGGQFADQRFDVYAAPPAQGSDLGQLRALADQWKQLEYPFSYEGNHAQRATDACRTDLLALIDDQRDAAPGVGNG